MSTLTRTALSQLLASSLLALSMASCGSKVTSAGASSSSAQSTGAAGAGGGSAGMGGAAASSGSASGGGGGSASGGGGGSGSGGAPVIAYCANQVYACGNGIDDDGDGLVDAQDPYCVGPCDTTEESFDTAIPYQGPLYCFRDCYFDMNGGAGDDECRWNHQCDPLSVPPNYYPQWWSGDTCAYDENAVTPGTSLTCDEMRNGQSPQCLDACQHLTPNGCDCFGCCELPAGSGKFVWLGSEDGMYNGTCTLDGLGDPLKCAPCTPVKTACYNDCGPCELCLGKTELPPECAADAGNGEQCATGIQPCGLSGQGACPSGTYCITGCCQPTPK